MTENLIPIIYDVSTDEYRVITQGDVYHLQRVQHAYGQLRLAMMRLLDETKSMINDDDNPRPLLGALRTMSE